MRNEAVAFARSKLGVPYAVDFEAPFVPYISIWYPYDFVGFHQNSGVEQKDKDNSYIYIFSKLYNIYLKFIFYDNVMIIHHD